jgi:CO/xanthine dehydrogenase FAD-binding subunit
MSLLNNSLLKGFALSHPKLSSRQAYVVERMYLDFGWSAVAIALALDLGRRTIENALRRRGVQVMRRSKKAFEGRPELTPAAAKQWFDRAATEELADLEPPSKPDANGTEVFRRRRCQACSTLNSYISHCSACGEMLDWNLAPSLLDRDATELRKLEEYR